MVAVAIQAVAVELVSGLSPQLRLHLSAVAVCLYVLCWSDDCPSQRKMQETDTEAAAEAATGAEAAAAAAAEAINIEMEIEKGIENYR